MMIFQDKATIKKVPNFKKGLAIIFALPFFLLAYPSVAQEQSGDDQRSEEQNLGSRIGPMLEQDDTIGTPRSILPGPYVPLGTIAANVEAPIAVGETQADEPTRDDTIAVSEIDEDSNSDDNKGEEDLSEDDPFRADDLGRVDELGELDRLDPATIGLLTPSTGGLRADVWLGTAREKIEILFAMMPVATRSPAVNEIVNRVLLSATNLPLPAGATRLAGRDPELAEFIDLGLLEVRLEKLAYGGKLSGLLSMLDRIPGELLSPAIQRLRVDAYLLDGDVAGACAASHNARSEDGAAYWLKVLSFCQALSGDEAGTSFSLSLLAETGEAPRYFVRLVEEVLDLALIDAEGERTLAPAPDMPTADLNALTLALLRTVGREVPFNVLDGAPPMVLRATVERADLPLDFRADAAEAAVVRGAVDGEILAKVFDAMSFTEGERESVIILAETEQGSRIDGLIYSMALEESDARKKADLVVLGWKRAGRQNTRSAVAPVLVRVVETISVTEEYISFAETAGRVSLFARRGDLAELWYAQVRSLAAKADLEATKALVNLWPLMIAADQGEMIPYSENILNLWRQSLSVLPSDEQYRRVGFFLGVIEALGYKVPSSYWDESLKAPKVDAGRAPSAPLWRQMLVASREEKRGETLLLSLAVIGEDGFSNYSNAALTSLIRALVDTGFEPEARTLAVEALIETGF